MSDVKFVFNWNISESSLTNIKKFREKEFSMKNLDIDWLGDCPTCGSNLPHQVETTKGNENLLYDGDKVTCTSCGAKGIIEADGRIAEVIWEEV